MKKREKKSNTLNKDQKKRYIRILSVFKEPVTSKRKFLLQIKYNTMHVSDRILLNHGKITPVKEIARIS